MKKIAIILFALCIATFASAQQKGKNTFTFTTGKYTDMTDETRVLYQEYGIPPTFLQGGENLYKVTYPKDLAFLESNMADFF